MLTKRNIFRNLKKASLEPAYALHALGKRVRSYASLKFQEGKSIYPESITLFLTYRCNLHCFMCGQWGERGESRNYSKDTLLKEVPIEVLEKLLEEVSHFKPNITLFGGEPLLYKNFIRLIKTIKKHKLHCTIITNGTLIKEVAHEIVENGVDVLSLSIDGPSEVHDKIRNARDGFKKIKEGADAINTAKKQFHTKLPIINIVCVVSHMNYSVLHEMLTVADSMKASTLNFHHLIYVSPETFEMHSRFLTSLFGVDSHNWQGFIYNNYDKIDVGVLLNEVKKIKANLPNNFYVTFFPNFTNDEIKKYYTDPGFISKGYQHTCLSPWVTTYVYPNGDVIPCLNIGYSVGNIKNESFKEMWNNERYKWYRRVIQENKGFPVCPRCTEYYRY